MSGFDDNPFADPFAEPSIQQATQSSNQSGLEEYDPFSAQPTTNSTVGVGNTVTPPTYVQPTVSAGAGGQPAVVTPTMANPPSYRPSAQQQVTTAEFQRRQEELEKKAQELARKEEELRNAGTAGAARQDNWPPLPSGFPIGPCFYQDINVDIPLEFQKIVRMLYYLWMFHALMLLLNILGGLGLFIAFDSGVTFGLAILYFLIFTPFSYICWFRPVYKAFRSDSSFNFMVFFFVFFFQLMVSIVNAIGIPSMGTCGIILGLTYLGASGVSYKLAGVFILILAAGFAMVAVADLAALSQLPQSKHQNDIRRHLNSEPRASHHEAAPPAESDTPPSFRVHRIYRSTGASFAKAQVEFSQGVMRNEHVQTLTANAASAAVRSQFTGSTTPGGTASSPRF